MTEQFQNRILRRLQAADESAHAEIVRELARCPLERGMVLAAPGGGSEFVYFVESGAISLMATSRTGTSVEVALTGCEGAAGVADALGRQPLPYKLIVQLPGLARRVPTAVIREHMLACSALHELLLEYSQRLMHQLAQSALCNRFHTSLQRLARWLLLTAECAGTNRFELTHDFAAQMVGAPRSAVTGTASALRDKGIIDYRRGVLTIRQPRRLEQLACECFGALSLSRAASMA